jgi:hypothetical protein
MLYALGTLKGTFERTLHCSYKPLKNVVLELYKLNAHMELILFQLSGSHQPE